MTNRLIRLFLTCIALTSASMAQSAQVSNMAPCAPNAAPQTTTLESFLIVHVVCSDVLLEIPVAMLGRTLLLYTEFAALSTGGSEYAPGSAIDSRAVRWARFGNKVALLTVNYDNWAGESVELQKGIDAIALPTVIEVFDVVKEGADGAPVIDITSLFTTNSPRGFALEFKRH